MTSALSRERVICFGELLLRLSAPAGEMLLQSPALQTCFGGAEANVAVALARLGHRVAMVTTVADNAIGVAARDSLRAFGVDTDEVAFQAGRMGLYFLTPGAVLRQSEIIYDRAGSAFAQAAPDMYDWTRLLAGADWLHVSGISVAVSERSGQCVLEAARAARKLGVKVSFDGNYRASLWAERGVDGAAQLAELMACADMAFADQRDIALLLGSPDLAEPQRRHEAVTAAFEAFPQLQRIAATSRTQHGVTRHELGASLYMRDAAIHCPPYRLDGIVDRIGTGDAFAAGLLHGLRLRWDGPDALAFALAAAAFKHGTAGDFTTATESQIRALQAGALEVRR